MQTIGALRLVPKRCIRAPLETSVYRITVRCDSVRTRRGLDVPGARWLQVLVNITGGEDAQGWASSVVVY